MMDQQAGLGFCSLHRVKCWTFFYNRPVMLSLLTLRLISSGHMYAVVPRQYWHPADISAQYL